MLNLMNDLETENGIKLPGARKGVNMELLSNGHRNSAMDDEKVLEIDSGNGYTTM